MNRAERRSKPKRKPKPLRKVGLVEAAVFQSKAKKELGALKTDAGLHAFAGADAEKLVNICGRLIFVTAFAVGKARLGGPDARILVGAASALGDLFERPHELEAHRATIQGGLKAIDRLLPGLGEAHLAHGIAVLEVMLASPEGLTLNHIRDLLEN